MIAFQHPFSMIIAGPSMSGKSYWMGQLVRYNDTMIYPPPAKIYLCYTEWQPLYDTLSGVEFHKGMLDVDSLDSSIPKLLVADDMMQLRSKKIAEIFTKHAHHRNLSIIFITQNIYHQSQEMRTMNLNASYLVLFNTPRDKNQIACLSQQMYGSRFLVPALEMAMELSPRGYLVIDLKPGTDEIVRVRTKVFPTEFTYIFLPSNKSLI